MKRGFLVKAMDQDLYLLGSFSGSTRLPEYSRPSHVDLSGPCLPTSRAETLLLFLLQEHEKGRFRFNTKVSNESNTNLLRYEPSSRNWPVQNDFCSPARTREILTFYTLVFRSLKQHFQSWVPETCHRNPSTLML